MARVAQLPKLKVLMLSDTKVGDKGLLHLTSMPNLWFLKLDNTSITDAAAAPLQRMPALQEADVERFGDDAQISEAAADELLRAKPSLTLY